VAVRPAGRSDRARRRFTFSRRHRQGVLREAVLCLPSGVTRNLVRVQQRRGPAGEGELIDREEIAVTRLTPTPHSVTR